MRRQRAAPADLYGVSQRQPACRLTDHAYRHFLAVRGHPFKQRRGTVDRVTFLVTGDRHDDGAVRRRLTHQIDRRGGECGDA